MLELRTKSDYHALSVHQRFEVFDEDWAQLFKGWAEDEIYQLLYDIILSKSENSNLRKKALAALSDYVMIGKIKVRRALYVLIDSWPEDADLFLHLQRVKDLHLYYSLEPSEVEKILRAYQTASETELSSEANYRMGLIRLQQALEQTVNQDRIPFLEQSSAFLSAANSEIENREDAGFIRKIAHVLWRALINYWDKIDDDLEELGNLLFQMQAKSFHFRQNVLLFALYRGIQEMRTLRSGSAEEWLDFREELTKIYSGYSELQNQKLKDRLVLSNLSSAFVELISTSFVEPYFVVNLSANRARVDARLQELPTDSTEAVFLEYISQLLDKEHDKKKVPGETISEQLKRAFPNRSTLAIETTVKKITDEKDPSQLYSAFLELMLPDLPSFIDSLVQACITLQGNRMFRGDFSEDDRNTFITSMLTSGGYSVRDQTRWSKSAAGKSAGEIDIYVQDRKSFPYAIVEALNLDSLKKDYLILHLDKLFKYDTAGHPANFILVYCNVARYGDFWEKYCEFIIGHSYVYAFQQFEELTSYPYANLKVCRTDHLREGRQVALYHIAVDLS